MKVLVTFVPPPETQKRLEACSFQLHQWQHDSVMPREQLLEQVKGADALICLLTNRVDAELLDAAGPQLKVVATMSVGYDHVDVEALRARDIKLGYTPDVLTDATADLTVLLVLAASRRLKEGMRAAESGAWREWRPTWLCGLQPSGKTLGIVGLGRIGEAVAKRLSAFGVDRIIYTGRQPKPHVEATFVSFDQLLEQSDIVVVCCALTSETRHMFNYEAFKKMKSSAVFVNTARGGIVQQDDLVRALQEQQIAAVGLDVTDPEPLAPDHPLYQFDNCIVLPHIASATIETRERMASMCLDNVLAGLDGKPLPYSV